MLNQKLLKNLTSSAPSSRFLLEMAWQSLAVESKLEIVDEFANKTGELLPNWLLKLALEDEHKIIQLWAASKENLSFSDSDSDKKSFEHLQKRLEILNDDTLNALTDRNIDYLILEENFYQFEQQTRLIIIRYLRDIDYSNLLTFVKNNISRIPKSQLIECLDEFISKLENICDTKIIELDELNSAWDFTATLDEEISSRLARIFPIYTINITCDNQVKHICIPIEKFLCLKPLALFWILKKNMDVGFSKELFELAKIIVNDDAGRFDKYVIELAQDILSRAE